LGLDPDKQNDRGGTPIKIASAKSRDNIAMTKILALLNRFKEKGPPQRRDTVEELVSDLFTSFNSYDLESFDSDNQTNNTV